MVVVIHRARLLLMMEISGNHNDNVLNLVTVSYSYSDYSF